MVDEAAWSVKSDADLVMDPFKAGDDETWATRVLGVFVSLACHDESTAAHECQRLRAAILAVIATHLSRAAREAKPRLRQFHRDLER